jgi:CheY-like chemotaxis protein
MTELLEVRRSVTNQPSILLIEDESRLRHNLQVLLQKEGYRVVGTDNGAEGIKQIEAQCFNLVITDLVMPGIDGFQVLEAIRELILPKCIIYLTIGAPLTGRGVCTHGKGNADS